MFIWSRVSSFFWYSCNCWYFSGLYVWRSLIACPPDSMLHALIELASCGTLRAFTLSYCFSLASAFFHSLELWSYGAVSAHVIIFPNSSVVLPCKNVFTSTFFPFGSSFFTSSSAFTSSSVSSLSLFSWISQILFQTDSTVLNLSASVLLFQFFWLHKNWITSSLLLFPSLYRALAMLSFLLAMYPASLLLATWASHPYTYSGSRSAVLILLLYAMLEFFVFSPTYFSFIHHAVAWFGALLSSPYWLKFTSAFFSSTFFLSAILL